jgi:uncharacterized delta-60 repeat protein
MRQTFTLVFVFAFQLFLIAQPGQLDTSFGTGGKVRTFNPLGSYEASGIVIQPDGKIVLGASGGGIIAVRYNTDGTLDPSFGLAGMAHSALVNNVTDIQLQPDGRIVLLATSPSLPGVYVLRLNANGSPDVSFDGDGAAFIPLSGARIEAHALAIQPDGRIVLTGDFQNTANFFDRDIFIARLNSNGSPDTGFGTAGVVKRSIRLTDEAHDLQLQPDGKIVIAGSSGDQLNSDLDFLVLRLSPDGSYDNSFDGDGIVLTALLPGGYDEEAYALALQADGKILAAGVTTNYGRGGIVRYYPDGSLDPSFSNDGILFFPSYPASLETQIDDILVQPDGKILTGGRIRVLNGGIFNYHLARFLPDGTFDSDFGTGGQVSTDFAYQSDYLFGLALWHNRIYASGYAEFSPLGPYFIALSAYENNISTLYPAPYTLNGDATTLTPQAPGSNCMQLTPSAIYMAGTAWNNNQINLNQSFEISTKMYFGANDNGADGIAFVLQRAGTDIVGTAGGGLGYADSTGPSFIIEFDTYQNTAYWYDMSDPSADHLGFMSNGSPNHNPTGGTVLQAPFMLPNIENGLWNDVVFRWNAVTKTMTVTLMGSTYTYTGDIVNAIFGGNNMVYWGFTASTGSPLPGVTPNQQQVCIVSATSNLQGRAAMEPQLITRVQPNPSSGQFELQFNDDIAGRADVFISNSNGVVVERRSVNVTGTGRLEQFNLRNLPPGLYFIRVVSAKGTQTQKLIVQ